MFFCLRLIPECRAEGVGEYGHPHAGAGRGPHLGGLAAPLEVLGIGQNETIIISNSFGKTNARKEEKEHMHCFMKPFVVYAAYLTEHEVGSLPDHGGPQTQEEAVAGKYIKEREGEV